MRKGEVHLRTVLRNERKFLINTAQFMRTSHELRQLLHEDAHNGTCGYIIRSLYFDTAYDGDFFDKEYGMEIRKKLRLRIYDPCGESAVLEMKQKQGEQQRKRSLRMRKEDALRLIACDYSPLLRYAEPFAAECYALMNTRCYRPKTVIEYRRQAFVAKENDIRITFDHQIAATESNFDLFDPKLIMHPVMAPNMAVLEVKYNGFLLSYIRQMLAGIDQSELSVSKYCMARQLSYQPHL